VAVGLAILGVVAGQGPWTVLAVLVLYNLIRLATGVWALRTGLASGVKVGAAIGDSWLPRAASWAGPAAGLVVGLAVPVAADWLLGPEPLEAVAVTIATLLLGLAASWRLGPRITAVKFGLFAIGLALILAWVLP
jgi:hypothetical protein